MVARLITDIPPAGNGWFVSRLNGLYRDEMTATRKVERVPIRVSSER